MTIKKENSNPVEKKSLKEEYIERQQNAFYREVQEEVKAEKLALLWNKYKKYIISTIIIVLSITIIKNLYNGYKKDFNLEQALTFEKIMSDEKISNEQKMLELSKFANIAKYGYKDIAYFNLYSMQIESKKTENALKTLNILINDATDETFKNLAIFKLGALTSSIKTSDTKEIKEELEDISKNEPFYAVSELILASIYIKENNFKNAEEILTNLTENEETPISIKSQGLTLLNFVKSNK